MFEKQLTDKLHDWLKEKPSIAITTHKNPDGDAIGSSLGMWHYLKSLGIDSVVVLPNSADHFLQWMPGYQESLSAESHPDEAKEMIDKAELIFCMDFSGLDRVGEMSEWIREASGKKIMVDHHIGPEDFADLSFHVVGASSTAELVFDIIAGSNHIASLTPELADCLYTGILTDTGSFRFSSTTSATLRAAAVLIERGATPVQIYNKIYDNFSVKRTRFLGYVLNEKMKVIPELRTSYMAISEEETERFDIIRGDTDGFVNYNLSLKGIKLGVFMKEAKGEVKMSFRSAGKFPANLVAGHFGGGGHLNAAGGRSLLNLEETEKKFLEVLELFKDELIADDEA